MEEAHSRTEEQHITLEEIAERLAACRKSSNASNGMGLAVRALTIAMACEDAFVTPIHLFLAILLLDSKECDEYLISLGINPFSARTAGFETLTTMRALSDKPMPPMSPEAEKVFMWADKTARESRQENPSPLQFLQGTIVEGGDRIRETLSRLGVEQERVCSGLPPALTAEDMNMFCMVVSAPPKKAAEGQP